MNLPERPVSSMQPMTIPAAATAAANGTDDIQVSTHPSTNRRGPTRLSARRQPARHDDRLALDRRSDVRWRIAFDKQPDHHRPAEQGFANYFCRATLRPTIWLSSSRGQIEPRRLEMHEKIRCRSNSRAQEASRTGISWRIRDAGEVGHDERDRAHHRRQHRAAS